MGKKDISPTKKKTVYGICAAICAVTLIFVIVIVALALSGEDTPVDPANSQQQAGFSDGDTSVEKVDYDEMYQAYKDNEIVANEQYKGNRYCFSAEINGINEGGGLIGLFDSDLGAKLTLVRKVGNTIVYIGAEFDKDQLESLKQVKVGDTITIEGECSSAQYWVECKVVE
jgi:hypothetical protein